MRHQALEAAKDRGRRKRAARAARFALGLALVGWFGSIAAPAARAADTLPPVSLSSTTFHVGDTITLSGTGCVDPTTGSGTGADVSLLRPSAPNGRGNVFIVDVRADVAADGSFSGSGTVVQPVDFDGPQVARVVCLTPGGTLTRDVPIEVVAPRLPDLTVTAGSTIDFQLTCTTGRQGRLQFDIGPGQSSGPRYFSTTDPPGPGLNQQGDIVHIAVPADLAPGTYLAQVVCYGPGTGLQNAFRLSLTVNPADTSGNTTTTTTTTVVAPRPTAPGSTGVTAGATTAAQAAGAATGATPVRGSAAFTG